MRYVYLVLAVAFNVASYLLYKSISDKQSSVLWYAIFISGLILGCINVFFFTKALKSIPLGIAYSAFSGGCIFFMVLLSYVIFGERISALNMVGAAVVAVGIALMSN
jgi:multidrug transporter EmrE-like cation transporter